MRIGTRLAIDLGEVRIGVARCDPHGILASPVATVYRAEGAEIEEILGYINEYEAFEVIIGLPLLMGGTAGKNVADVKQWAKLLKQAAPTVNIRLVDERLTSVSAHQKLNAAGVNRKKHKKMVDQQAAVLILEQALEIEKGSGKAPGEVVE